MLTPPTPCSLPAGSWRLKLYRMGWNIHKVEYDCDIIHDPYGICNHKNAYIMVLSRSTDYWKLFHRIHDGELFSIDSFTDNEISALQKIFERPGHHSPDEGVKMTDKEISEIKEKLFKP